MQSTWTLGRFKIILMHGHTCKFLLNTSLSSGRAVEQLAGCLAKQAKAISRGQSTTAMQIPALSCLMGLNTFTSFDAPSCDMCGWSMHIEVWVQRVILHVIVANKILSVQLESTHSWSVDGSKELEV